MEATAPSPVKIAIIGAGVIGPRHAQAVKQNSNTLLVCIVDPTPTAISTAIRLGTSYYPSVAAMLQSSKPKPDVAIVCSPNHTHVDISTTLLSAGIHVLCEKPLSTDSASGRALVAHAAAQQLHLLTGHHRRFNPYVVAAKRILSNKECSLGHITAVSGLWALHKPQEYFNPPAQWHRSADEGGPVMINLIHDIDVLHFLLDSRVHRVAAFEATKRRGYDAEEGGAVILHFENGVVGTFVLSDAVVSPHAFELGTGENPIIPRTGRDAYRIFGTDGTLSIPDLRRAFYGANQDKSWINEVQEVSERLEDWLSQEERGKIPFELQIDHLVEVVRGNQEAVCTGQDGLAAVRVAEAVKIALRTGQVVTVED
ncbi:oxidoreductase [Coniella lustricola]|uniref:Oxidoreductase n=1 Tax=Coniella lustricola TaxID=2025994 RepID=A0A2T3A009_9PEZI|nr:oxidoreductase [Coniella lustricola]